MDLVRFEEGMGILKDNLGDGLISADVFVTGTGQSFLSHNGGNVKFCALFDKITAKIKQGLKIAKLEEIEPYYLFHLEDGNVVLLLLHDKYQWGMTVNPDKSPLGLLLNVAIPSLLEKINEA